MNNHQYHWYQHCHTLRSSNSWQLIHHILVIVLLLPNQIVLLVLLCLQLQLWIHYWYMMVLLFIYLLLISLSPLLLILPLLQIWPKPTRAPQQIIETHPLPPIHPCLFPILHIMTMDIVKNTMEVTIKTRIVTGEAIGAKTWKFFPEIDSWWTTST